MHQFVAAKRALFRRYETAFADVCGIHVKKEPADCQSNYWLQTLVLDTDRMEKSADLLRALNGAGYMSRPPWMPMHQLSPYRDCPRMDLNIAESLAARLINIPSSVVLSESEAA
jgi:dTDP-4-amino-4,6-dideoxygalactose transaminase